MKFMALTFPIEIAYASQNGSHKIINIEANAHWTVEQAIMHSGILQLFSEICLSQQKVGIFGKIVSLSDCIKPGDRIEIYRPLKIDPKEARRLRS